MSTAMHLNSFFPTPRRFFLIDPTLRDAAGHNLDYARIVVAEVVAAGFDCRVYSHASSTIGVDEMGCPVEPWFSRGHKDVDTSEAIASSVRRIIGRRASSLARTIKRTLTHRHASPTVEGELKGANAFAVEVGDMLRTIAPTSGDRLFFPNVLWNEAVRIVETLNAAGFAGIAETQILLRFDPPTLSGAAGLLGSVGQVRGITWLADTEELAEAYSALLQTNVRRVRVPIEGAAIRARAKTRPAPDPVVVLAPGESRREKGFHLLPKVVEHTLAVDSGVEFRIQMSPNVPGGEPGIHEAMSRLRRLEGPKLKLLPAKVSSSEFTKMLGGAHVLLLPYDARSYTRRSSGLLVQGLAAGLWIAGPNSSPAISACIGYNGRTSQAVLCDSTIEGFASAVVEAARRARTEPAPRIDPLREESLPSPWAT